MSRWLRGAVKHTNAMTAEEEVKSLQDAEQALLHLLNDNIVAADKILKEGHSSFHHLGRGISSFIAAMLAAEKDLLKETAAVLQDAENRTWDDMKRAEKASSAFRSDIYPPGTEYLLCYSIAQLTSAICHVLSGSVTEAIRGFYKLRKAYITLDGIMQTESKHFKTKLAGRRLSITSTLVTRQETEKSVTDVTNGIASADINGGHQLQEKPSSNGVLHSESAIEDISTETHQPVKPVFTRTQSRLLDVDPASVGISSHIDIFIHSGTRLCYGLLLIVFSMIENSLFTTILHIVGFSGDRERGTRYLWQAARFNNFNSAIAGISLLGFYNGLVGFCDILPTDPQGDDDLAGYPKARCEALLTDMLSRYPESKLWRLEEARKHSYNRNLDESVKILLDNSDSGMKQIAVINVFELSLTSMFNHDYDISARSWMQCSELSTWSPCLYAYCTGISFLELYRNTRHTDPKAAEVYKQKATEHIRKAPPLAGKQKVMSRELPFDTFIKRKVAKWEARVKAWGVDLVDATGTSPFTEMIYLWNGMKKQGESELEKSFDALQWEKTSHPEKFENDLDEKAIHDVVTASVWRNQNKIDKAEELVKEGILSHERNEFRGIDKDDWTHPTAYYEMAALAWVKKDLPNADHKAKAAECEQWLERLKNYGDVYLLDSRLSLKLSTSLVTLKRHKRVMKL